MPSPTKGTRWWVEALCRAVAGLSLGIMALTLMRGGVGRQAPLEVGSVTLPQALTRATQEPVTELRLRADHAPTSEERDWLRALRASGTSVSWQGTRPLRPSAISMEPAVTLGGEQGVTLLASPGTTVVLSDDVGRIDSVSVGPLGRLTLSGTVAGEVTARLGTGDAPQATAQRADLGRVLVLGRADWESKYVMAALEESGWQVDARVRVSPEVVMTQGTPQALDTSRYAAVVVLDSGVTRTTELAGYARSGGGLLVAGTAVEDPSLLSLAGGAIGPLQRAEIGALVSSNPRRGLTARAISARDPMAVVLEARASATVMLGRRVGLGRVAASGYLETWRWRMQGGEGSVEAHRAWWSNAVGGVAHVRPLRDGGTGGLNGAPLAALHAVLGPPATTSAMATTATQVWVLPLTFLVALLSLLAEWTSRRLRGAR
ncbi:MAG: hypothetical protein U0132_08080 [Gemmatimonadaceae bacterium]